MAVAQIDTRSIPTQLRTENWREFTARTMVDLSCSTLDPSGIVGRQVNVRRPHHTSILIESQPHFIQRTPLDAARSPSGMVQLSFIDQGQIHLVDETGMHAAHRGNALVFDTDRPYAMMMPYNVVMRTIHVPKSRLQTGQDSHLPAHVASSSALRGDSERLKIWQRLNEFLDLEFRMPGRVAWEPHFDPISLVESVLDSIMPVHAASPWWDEIIQEVRNRLRDPGLRAHQVAAAIPLSERQLTRILAAHQVNWQQLLLQERLQQLRSDLLSAHTRHRSIREIIMDCGFSSAAHAHRRFREATGMTPGAYRTQHGYGTGGHGERSLRFSG